MASSLGSLVVQHDAAARITSEKSPRQPTRAGSHKVITRVSLKVIGADGALIERRRQSGGRRRGRRSLI
jgi:hypothetical protein